MRKILLTLLLPAVFLAGCDGSIFEGISNKNTDEAITDDIDFAYITGNCQKVVDYYAGLKNSGAILSVRESSIYSNAMLACSGFDIMNGIDSILSGNNVDDVYGALSSVMGTDTINESNLADLQGQYNQILENCKDAGKPLPKEMENVCGLTAASDTVLDIAGIILEMNPGTDIVLTEEGLTEAVSGMTEEEINSAVGSFESQGKIDDLNENLEYVENVSGSLGLDNSVFDTIKDPNTNQVTSDSLANLINGFGGVK